MATDPGMIPSLPHSLTSSWAAATAPGAKGGRGVWLWLAMVVVLAGTLVCRTPFLFYFFNRSLHIQLERRFEFANVNNSVLYMFQT